MFDWYKKERLDEQLKFFGGKRKGFVSCYSKEYNVKPRVVVKVKAKSLLVCNDNNRQFITGQGNNALLANMGGLGGQGGLGGSTAQGQALYYAQQQANIGIRQAQAAAGQSQFIAAAQIYGCARALF